MAKKKDVATGEQEIFVASDADDISGDLIKAINKEFGNRIAYNLSTDESPTEVKRWLPTGSAALDFAIANKRGGGYPEGRIIEIAGLPSTGKSHLALRAARAVQQQGGLVVYIDTENATSVELLGKMGIDTKKRFVYCSTSCTEEVFSIIESTILKAKQIIAKNVPILVVFDSVGGASPKAELEGDYDQNSVGLQARTLAKGFRKITGVIGQNNVTLLCLNQLTTAIGVTHGDPFSSKGGNALPYHASVRIRLGSGNQVKNKDGDVIGAHVTVSIKKNKVAPPFRKLQFDIIFGKGIVDDDYVFDDIRAWCDASGGLVKDGKVSSITGTGAWKDITVSDQKTGEVLLTKKFYKADFNQIRLEPKFADVVLDLIEATYVSSNSTEVAVGESPSSDEE